MDGGKVQLLLTSLAGTLHTVHSRNTVVLEKTLESPLDWKEIRPVNLKGNQPLIFIGRTDAEAPILWLPDAKSWLIRKDPEAGKNWGQEEKGVTEDEMVGWHHWLSGHECEQTPEVGKGQGSLVCYTPRGRKESDTTQRMNNNKTWQEPVMKSLGLGGHFLVKFSSLEEQAWVGGESSFHCHFFAHQSFAPPPPHVHILTPAWVSLSTIPSAKHRNMEWKTVISNHFLQSSSWNNLLSHITEKSYLPAIHTTPCRWLSGKGSTWQCRRQRRRGFNPSNGKIPWRRKWQPTPAFLPGKFPGQRSLAGYCPWGH